MNSLKSSIKSMRNSMRTSDEESLSNLSPELSSIPTKTKTPKSFVRNNSRISKTNEIVRDELESNEFKNKQNLDTNNDSPSNNIGTANSNIFFSLLDKIRNFCFGIIILVILFFLLAFLFRDKIINLAKNSIGIDLDNEKKTEKKSKKNDLNGLTKKISDKIKNDDSDEIEGDDSKSGFCYIGKVNDTRKCAKISDKKYCMSGEFFSTKQLCKNANIKDKK